MNHTLSDLIDLRYGRRAILMGGAAAAGLFAMPAFAKTSMPLKTRTTLGFDPVPPSMEDQVVVPSGYRVQVLIPEGEPLLGNVPAYTPGDGNSGADRERQIGAHHDGMWLFPVNGRQANSHGLLCVNHENIDLKYLHSGGGTFDGDRMRPILDEVRKEVASHGVSVIELVADTQRKWKPVDGRYNRRITAETPMEITGPARGNPQMHTKYSPDGTRARGTLNNCASGHTPWNTYITCEENFPNYFVAAKRQPRSLKRYDVPATRGRRHYGWGTRSEDQYVRFDATVRAGDATQDYRNEPNQFGWVVEIDPFDPDSTPKKRTALGRMRHEGATVAPATPGKPLVVYMGDDAKGEYLYKFVSTKDYSGHKADRDLLDDGTLYVARLEPDGSGKWLALKPGANGLTPEAGFENLGDILINTRSAADHVKATKLDRPESVTVDARTGHIYMTLTNNSKRGVDTKQPVDAANPRAANIDGHILRWREEDGDYAAGRFRWDIFAFGGPTHETIAQLGNKKPYKGDVAYAGRIATSSGSQRYLGKEATFNSPDGIFVAPSGLLWILTDGYANADRGFGHQQMLACDPDSGDIRRFLVGPKGCEITGITTTPDAKTLFINIQHPGNGSIWPNIDGETRPRSATVVITKKDGGVIGS